jgi:hypothetical protein
VADGRGGGEDRRLVADVHPDRPRPDRLGRLDDAGLVAAGDDHVVAVGDEPLGDRAPDPPVGAGHQRAPGHQQVVGDLPPRLSRSRLYAATSSWNSASVLEKLCSLHAFGLTT